MPDVMSLLAKGGIPVVSFIAGNLTMFFAKRHLSLSPKITYSSRVLEDREGIDRIFLKVTLSCADVSYKLIRMKANTNLFICGGKESPGEFYGYTGSSDYIKRIKKGIKLKNYRVQSTNIKSHSDCVLAVILPEDDHKDIYLSLWLRLDTFPYFIHKRQLIMPKKNGIKKASK